MRPRDRLFTNPSSTPLTKPPGLLGAELLGDLDGLVDHDGRRRLGRGTCSSNTASLRMFRSTVASRSSRQWEV
jgi:hypothetical protein